MDEHNIEELKRQLKLATDRQQQAAQDVSDAKQRLQDARNAASGVMGHVLEYTKIRGWGSKEKVVTRRLIVDRVTEGWAPGEAKPLIAEGYLIIASGAKGQLRGSIGLADAKDLGLFQSAKVEA